MDNMEQNVYQDGSHMKCLKDPGSTIGSFMERAERLGACLGPILVQLKPNWALDLERLLCFLRATPEGQRWAFEFRDPSWLCDAVFDALRQSMVLMSTPILTTTPMVMRYETR